MKGGFLSFRAPLLHRMCVLLNWRERGWAVGRSSLVTDGRKPGHHDIRGFAPKPHTGAEVTGPEALRLYLGCRQPDAPPSS